MEKSTFCFTAVKTNPNITGLQTTSRSRLKGPLVNDGFNRIGKLNSILVKAINEMEKALIAIGANPETIKFSIEISKENPDKAFVDNKFHDSISEDEKKYISKELYVDNLSKQG